ncbi:MAG: DUF790 family protein, partial [Thermoproteota archaeon]|nr:DUF790 family protein [Thermoproteota archaeon]
MIPFDLLRYKLDNRNYKIYPVLCSIERNSKDIEIATQVIQAFEYCYNHNLIKEKLDHSLRDLEITYKDYKLVRGLSTILERRCTFSSSSQLQSKDIKHIKNDTRKQTHDIEGSRVNHSATEIRRIVFDESARQGIAINENKRKLILEKLSNRLNTSYDLLSRMMWSDLEENSVIDIFLPASPHKLLVMYNISLIQTLLFSCLKMKLELESSSSVGTKWKEILREVKRLGLMYWLEVHKEEQNSIEDKDKLSNGLNKRNRIICTIEGALNVLKLTDRYGNAISKILPIILTSDKWSINADILRITNNGKKIIYVFEISHNSYPNSIPPLTAFNNHDNYSINKLNVSNQSSALNNTNTEYSNNDQNLDRPLLDTHEQIDVLTNTTKEPRIFFDSKIERKFLEQFELFQTGWTIEREPEPIITKQKAAFIPDFVLSKFGNQVIVEIIGFWTKEYLERKISKISDVIQQNKNQKEKLFMILVINLENLMSYEIIDNQKLTKLQSDNNVLITSYKRDKILFKDIISYLKEIENNYLNHEVLNESNQQMLIQNVTKFLEKIKSCDLNVVPLGDLEMYLQQDNNFDNNFSKIRLKELIDKNIIIKGKFYEELAKYQVLLINQFFFKKEFTKEILDKIKSIDTLGEASKLLES